MKLLKDTIWNSSSPRPKGNFLRPLVVALVMLLFSSLILVMGIMDMGRLDKTLVGFMENRGLDIITAVENVAQENLAYLYQTLKDDKDERENAFVPIDDEEESAPQKALTKGLVALAREIDIRWKAEHLNEEDLRKIADREDLWLIAVLDKRGRIVFKSREFLAELLTGTNQNMAGDESLIIDLFNRFGKLNEMGYITLRRKDGSGAILIALNDEGLRSWWGPRIVIKKAIEEVGGDQQGLDHLVVINRSGRILGQAGNVQKKFKDVDAAALDVLKGKIEKNEPQNNLWSIRAS